MSSGMFKVKASEASELITAKNLIQKFIDANWTYILSGETGSGQFDNAAIDGSYIGKLRVAVSCIDDCIEGCKEGDHNNCKGECK